ncbi:MAG: nucleotide sugar dehydrogenase [Sporocytophaga sp.]|uniref:nucleotide sugar dehydrogenase n=1 Tax=Sporocytophaga sp. TaxID=2231183 RepID=UPI001B11F475|nr:nucleotide sugar dehydrogenase [Sporocytophaga sp.]MBO9702302.1 nucleotide sugar dehydrogenase [Sporocytophaga sp.]
MDFNIYDDIVARRKSLCVVGLGYVGLPIALEFAKKTDVVGFDINSERIGLMQKGIDPSGELDKEEFLGKSIIFTHSVEDLKDVNFFIVAVPTPIDTFNHPDLKPLIAACNSVGKVLKKGDYVVFESTVYPGCTEEDCIPILERVSGLKFNKDFKVGYSPERINPGDKEHTLSKIIKVVAGSDDYATDEIAKIYALVVEAGIHKASSIKVAESAKIIENTQRDLNIALMNELSIICDKLGINTYEVLEAAATKWNFLKFTPGLVGGHCIGVDPYYLTHKAKSLGYNPNVILSGRSINDNMGAYIAKKTIQLLIKKNKNINQSKVLIMGATFKENVEDIRNSKVVDVIRELRSFSLTVDIIDPHASSEDFEHEYGISINQKTVGPYDAIVMAVPHKEYTSLDLSYFSKLMDQNSVFIDLKGMYRNQFNNLTYWSL